MIRLAILEVTPLMIVCNVLVDVAILFVLIIDEVATNPLISVVSIFSVDDCVKELMNCFTPEDIPLIIFSK